MAAHVIPDMRNLAASLSAVLVIVAAMSTPAVRAQEQSTAKPRFEVASVKPSAWKPPIRGPGEGRNGGGGGCPTSLKLDRSQVDIKCATIEMLIGYAFRFPPNRVMGPEWMMSLGSPRFDISAKLPQGASESQVPEMFQALLADRFGLALHRGVTTQAIYALVVTKGGFKMKEAAPLAGAAAEAAAQQDEPSTLGFFGNVQDQTTPNANGRGSTTTISNPRMGIVRQTNSPNLVQRWETPGITMDGLSDLLDKVAPVPSPVVNMTGLKGRYPLDLEVSLSDLSKGGGDPAAAGRAPMEMEDAVLKRFNDGLRKLGLQLERRKGPLETLIVDRVEKTPTEN